MTSVSVDGEVIVIDELVKAGFGHIQSFRSSKSPTCLVTK